MSEVAEELVQAASTEIAEYCPIAAGLAELKRKYANVVVDVSTTKALDEAKRVRAEIREPRYETEKIRKALKAPALAHAKLIDAEAARITAELLAIETPWDDAIKAEEARKEAEKAAREAAEKARIMAITDRIAGIRQYVELAASCRTAARIYELQEKLARISMDGFEEFSDEAAAAHADAMKRVEAMLVEKHLQEQEQEKVKAEQAAQAAALKAEREAFAAQQAAAKAEADRVAAEHAAKVATEKAEQAAKQAELDRQRAEIEAANAATQAAAEAQRAALAAERAEFEAQVAAAKRAAEQAEAERLDALREIEIPPVPEIVIGLAAAHVEQAPAAIETEAPTCCAPDGICTDACSNKPDDKWQPQSEPSDADIVFQAATAVANHNGWTLEQAIERLAEVQWTI